MSLMSDLWPAIQRNLGGRNDTDTQNMAINAVNLAQRWFCLADTFPELEQEVTPTLTTGTYLYTISSFSMTRFRKIKSWKIDNDASSWPGKKLTFVSSDVWDEKIAPTINYSGEKKPTYWTTWGGNIQLDSKPDQDYTTTLRYWQWPIPVTDISSTIQMTEMDDGLILVGTAVTFMSLEEFESAKFWLQLAQAYFTSFGKEQLARGVVESVAKMGKVAGAPGAYWSNPFVKENP